MKNMLHRNRKLLPATLSAWLAGQVIAHAVPRVWDGGSTLNNNLNTAANWNPDGAPNAGDQLIFPVGLGAGDRSPVNNFPAATLFSGLVFNAAGFTLNGADFRIGTDGILIDPSAAAGPISSFVGAPVTLNVANTWTVGSADDDLNVNTLDMGAFPLSVTGAGKLQMRNVTGTGAGARITLGAVGSAPELFVDTVEAVWSPSDGILAQNGRLIIRGSVTTGVVRANAVNALVSSLVGGTGSVHTLSAAGGTVAPGLQPTLPGSTLPNHAVGTLTVTTGGFSMNSSSALNIPMDDSLSVQLRGSQLVVTGPVSLAGTLIITELPGMAVECGQRFPIIVNDGTDPVAGTFTGIPEGTVIDGGRYQYAVSYTGDSGGAASGNDVVLTVVNIDATGLTRTWTGATSVFFETATNWSTAVPADGDNMSFPPGATRLTMQTQSNAALVSAQDVNVTAVYTFNGTTPLTLYRSLFGNSNPVFNCPVTFDDCGNAPEIYNEGASAWTFNGVLTNQSATPLLFNAGAAASLQTVNGDIVSNAGVLIGETSNSNGIVAFNSDKSFTGPVVLASGATLEARTTGALGTGAQSVTLQGNSSVLELGPETVSANLTYAKGVTVTGSGEIRADNGNQTLSGNVALNTSTRGRLSTAGSSDRLTVTGIVSGSGGLNISGGGIVEFSGSAANSFAGSVETVSTTVNLRKTDGNAIGGSSYISRDASTLWFLPQQINDLAGLEVRQNGSLFLLNNSETVASLTLDGRIETGTGVLTTTGNLTSLITGTQTSQMLGNFAFPAALGVWTVADAPGVATDVSVRGVVTGGRARKLSAGLVVFEAGTSDGSSLDFDAEQGTLRVNSATTMDVTMKGGRLEGSGTVASITGGTGSGSVIEPGAAGAGTASQLTSTAAVSLNSSCTLRCELGVVGGATVNDSLIARSTVSLGNAALQIALIGTAPSLGDEFVLIARETAEPVTGTFNGLAEGAFVTLSGATYRISYRGGPLGNAVTLSRAQQGTNATLTWTGASTVNSNWATAQNWNPQVVPAAGNRLIFPSTAARKTNVNTTAAGTTYSSIEIAGTGYAMSGNSIVLNDGMTVSGTHTLSMPIAAAVKQTWTASLLTNLTISGAVDLNGVEVTVAANAAGVARPAEVFLTGNITSSGDGTLRKTGTGTLTLSGTNVINGTPRLDAGKIILTSSGASGTGFAFVTEPGTVLSLEGAAAMTISRAITCAGLLAKPSGTMTHTLTNTLRMDGAASGMSIGAGTLAVHGQLIGGSYTASGPGTLELGGTIPNVGLGTAVRSGGPLRLAKSAGVSAISGDLTVIAGTAGTAEVTVVNAGQIDDESLVTLQRNGAGSAALRLQANETIRELDMTGCNVSQTNNSTLTVASGRITSRASDFSSAVSCPVNLNATACVLTVEDGLAAEDFSLSAVTGPAARVQTKLGAGVLRHTPLSAWDGSAGSRLDLVEGEFRGDGNMSRQVEVRMAAGTLAGDGVVGDILSAAAGGVIRPGPVSGTPGELECDSIVLNPATTLEIEIRSTSAPSGFGKLHCSKTGARTVNLGGAVLNVVALPDFVPAVGQTFLILENSSFTQGDNIPGTTIGTFAGLPENTVFTAGSVQYRINYNVGTDSNDVRLTVTGVTGTGTTRVWSGAAGGGDNQWTTAANWVPLPAQPPSAPQLGDSLRFPSGALQKVNVNTFPAGTTFDRMTVEDGGYQFTSSNGIRLNSGLVTTAAVNGLVNINTSIAVGSNQTWTFDGGAGASVVFLGQTIDLGTSQLTIANTVPVTIGAVTGAAAGTLTKQGPGLLDTTANAGATYAGSTRFVEGTVQMRNNNSFGTAAGATTVESAATLVLFTPVLTVTEPFTLRGTLTTSPVNGTYTLSGAVTLGPTVPRIDVTGTALIDFSGRLSGTVGFRKQGTGTVRLSGALANTFAGGVQIDAGTVKLAKTGNVVAQPGTTDIAANAKLEGETPNGVADNAIINVNAPTALYVTNVDTVGSLFFRGGTIQTSNGFTLSGNLDADLSAGATLIQGAVALTAGSHNWHISETEGAGGELAVPGGVANPPSGGGSAILAKTGNARLLLSGTNTVGNVSISAGEVLITGSLIGSSISMTGGLLSGSFTCSSFAATGGTVSPGTPADPTGLISASSLVLGNGAAFRFQASAADAASVDRIISATAPVLSDPVLQVEFLNGFVPAANSAPMSMIINTSPSPVTGQFLGKGPAVRFAGPAATTLTVAYNADPGANDITLASVPASTLTLTGGGFVPGSGTNSGSIVGTFTGLGPAGAVYRLQKSTDLQNWTDVQTFVCGDDGTWEVEAIEPAATIKAFYRVRGN